MKLTNNILAFSQNYGLKDLLDGFQDYYNHYKAEFMGKKVAYDTKVSFEEKGATLHQGIEKAIGGMINQSNMGFSETVFRTNPNYRWASFAIVGAMVDYVLADSINDSFYKFTEVRNIGYGDNVLFDVKPNNLFITTKAGNGKRHVFAQREFTGQVSIQPENNMITVEEDLYRILAGKRNLAEYAMKVARSMEEQVADDIYNSIMDTYSNLPTAFKTSGAFALADFVAMAQKVQAFNGDVSVNAFGTKLALANVLPATNNTGLIFDQAGGIGAEFTTNGFLGRVAGINLFELPQKANWTTANNVVATPYQTKLDDNKILIVSSGQEKLVKLVLEGEVISYVDDTVANANLVQRQTMHKRWKSAVVSNAVYGIMNVTS